MEIIGTLFFVFIILLVIGSAMETGGGGSSSGRIANPWRCICSDPLNIDDGGSEGWYLFRKTKAAELGMTEREYSMYIQNKYPTPLLLKRHNWSELTESKRIEYIAWEETNPEDRNAAIDWKYGSRMTPARTLYLSITQLGGYLN